jgi:hypothetical protein
MPNVWNAIAAVLLANPLAIDAYSAGDIGGALASAALRLVPFLLAAKWARNAALGQRTGWALKIVLAVWIIAWLAQNAAATG